MKRIRLGAVGYLNAGPLVYGLESQERFDLRYDVPSECARLLHDGAIDVGLIPSIEYLRGGPYRIVPHVAIASHGAVASVALYTAKPIRDVRSIAMDTSSRTSVALVGVLCARLFKIDAKLQAFGPDLEDMLAHCDAALIIGDNALFLEPRPGIDKIDLGEAWTGLTGLPFVYAFWAGRPDALSRDEVAALQRARDEGLAHRGKIARRYLSDRPERRLVAAHYLRHHIQYYLGDAERAGLETFFRYAAEAGVVERAQPLQFY